MSLWISFTSFISGRGDASAAFSITTPVERNFMAPKGLDSDAALLLTSPPPGDMDARLKLTVAPNGLLLSAGGASSRVSRAAPTPLLLSCTANGDAEVPFALPPLLPGVEEVAALVLLARLSAFILASYGSSKTLAFALSHPRKWHVKFAGSEPPETCSTEVPCREPASRYSEVRVMTPRRSVSLASEPTQANTSDHVSRMYTSSICKSSWEKSKSSSVSKAPDALEQWNSRGADASSSSGAPIGYSSLPPSASQKPSSSAPSSISTAARAPCNTRAMAVAVRRSSSEPCLPNHITTLSVSHSTKASDELRLAAFLSTCTARVLKAFEPRIW
mmetsp:Transcript_84155/g.123087  ORF Transcript_84155/g.123087 Transcript_84155/m.123087 type:complete len:332 (-) Transcript_84155:1623-2618(-)